MLVKEENNDLYHRYLDQREEELARRRAVIVQIQEMEGRIVHYERTFDFGEVREYGSLTDMSLADLQDKLIGLRFEMMERLREKRERIGKEKAAGRRELVAAREFVERARPQWQAGKRIYVEKARTFKEMREGLKRLPNVEAARAGLLAQSQERRKQRVVERESRLKIHDSAWDRYFYA